MDDIEKSRVKTYYSRSVEAFCNRYMEWYGEAQQFNFIML